MRRVFLILAVLGLCSSAFAQKPRLIKEANDYFAHGKYRAALQYYKQGGNAQTWDGDTRLRVAISQFEINDIDGAIPLLVSLIQEGKTDPQVFLYLARCYHHKNQFAYAVNYYKQFLRKFDDPTPLREWVKDEVTRCANGISLRYGVERAYVENMGAAINSVGEDFAPTPSPNYQERLYFTSGREDSKGGMLSNDGSTDQKFGSYRSDIYYT
ncbi:MAG TPA: tetratricopeptide repeat protein, partial [Anaerolineales bacterium]|nr:tetratricopeptide repeat protein [Anaerolineales bacterium]